MEQLKVRTGLNNTDYLQLEDIPEEFKFIELIAQQYASSIQELKKYYLVSLEAAEGYKSKAPKDKHDKNVAWVVRQTILKNIGQEK